MLAAPSLRGGFASRLAALVWGLLLCAVGIVCFLESKLGLPPWDVLHQGIAEQTGILFGVANLVVSAALVALAWALRAPIGPIHWAGAEYATTWSGYMDGALRSGEAAAAAALATL